MKTLSAIAVLASLSLPAAAAQCEFDYNINLRLAYSQGSFNVKNQGVEDSYNKTHNNASRIGGNLAYNCGKATFKYTHHSVIDWASDDKLTSKKIISTYSVSHDDYGTLTFGKLTTPYKAAGKNGDPFWDTASGTTFAANNFGFSAMTRGFTEKTLVYTAPAFGNFHVKFGYSGKSDGDFHHGLEYKQDKTVFGVQYLDLGSDSYIANGNGSSNALRLYGRHAFDEYLLTGSVENVKSTTGDNESFYNISLQKKITDFGRWAVSYGHVLDTNMKLMNGTPYQGDGGGLTGGVFYDWADNSEVYLLSSLLQFDGNNEQKSLVLGFNYHFNI